MPTVFSTIIVFLLLLIFPVLCVGNDDCAPIKCGDYGPIIRFPFRHKSRQPPYCGYNASFDLYCDQLNQTVIELPYSDKFLVRYIGYAAQGIQLSNYEQSCFHKNQTVSVNLSASPFTFSKHGDNWFDEYMVLNCSASNKDISRYYHPCSNGSSFGAYIIPSESSISYANLVSCTNLYRVFSTGYMYRGRFSMYLYWHEPACGRCESRGKKCTSRISSRGHELLCNNQPMKSKDVLKKPLISAEILGSVFLVVTLAYLYRLYIRIQQHRKHQAKVESFLQDYRALNPTRFSYAEIKKITAKFHERLGEGCYGMVYKGRMSDDFYVAVKVLNASEGNGEEFVNEVATIGRIHHVNIARLVGYCADGFNRALVYEYMPNGSLEKFIFQEGMADKIQDIALGIAKGIEYLHEGCDHQILHFDIKPSNILLDKDFTPKIGDFGLAKFCSKEQSAVSMTFARGTIGYIAPEVLSRTFGRASYKSDVYSFGKLLLDMVGGKDKQWIYDELLQQEEDEHRKMGIIGMWCIQWNPADRPSMKTVVQMLEGEGVGHLNVPPNPFPPSSRLCS